MLLSQTFGYGNLRMAGSQVAISTVILNGNDLRQNVDFERIHLLTRIGDLEETSKKKEFDILKK